MTETIIFDPLVPWPILAATALLAAAFLTLAIWRGLTGWALRALAALVLLAALAEPALRDEVKRPLSDIVVMVIDQSASQSLSDRTSQTAEAVARIEAQVAALPNTELRKVTLGDAEEDAGTLAMTALKEALAEEPRARLAGAIQDAAQTSAGRAASDLPAAVEWDLAAEDPDARLVAKLHRAGQLRPAYLIRALREEKLSVFAHGLGHTFGQFLQGRHGRVLTSK